MEVATRPQGSAVLSGGGGKPATIDLNSWKGLTEVLKVARESGMEADVYNDFRDTVLSYAQSGGDPELKKEIDAVVRALPTLKEQQKPEVHTEHGIDEPKIATESQSGGEKDSRAEDVPAATEAMVSNEEARAANPMGYTRLTPIFTVTKQRTSDGHTHESKRTEPTVTATEGANDVQQPVETKERAREVPQTKPEAKVIQQTNMSPTSEPQQQTVPSAAASDANITPISLPVEPQPDQTQSQYKSIDEYKARITEIKRDVNARVGNPVMLIDAENSVGREYMNALLAAMKATTGGTGDLDTAMGELETAYRRIIEVAPGPHEAPPTNTEDVADESPHTAESDTTATPVVSELSDSGTPSTGVVSHKDDQLSVPSSETAMSKGLVPNATPRIDESTTASAPGARRSPIPSLAEEMGVVSERSKTGFTEITKVPSETDAAAAVESAEASCVAATPAADSRSQTPGEHSMSIPAQLNHYTKDELKSEHVTVGLQQLLHEWKLFKSSGFFGTGPSGMEHPLYKHLAPLSMSSIISGRFENASPEIIQSIKDYTNAWRHEQGVSFTPSETFEHYLRRVVDRILKRQRSE